MVSEQAARRIFVGLIAVSLVLLWMVVRPFARSLFLAAVLAGALHNLHEKLSARLRGRPALAATLLVVAVVLALVGPVAALATYVVSIVIDGLDLVTRTVRREGVAGLAVHVPGPLHGAAQWFVNWLQTEGQGLEAALRAQVSARGATAAQAVTGVVTATGSIVLQLVMMLIAFFFLLTDGPRLVTWFESISPLKRGQTIEILREFRGVTVAVLVSSLVTAGVQALAALVGYLIARVPAPLFFTAVTFVLALVPAVGAAVVCLVASALLLVTGHPWAALFLAIWGVVVVGLSDNVVKPLLVKRGLHLHGAIVFFALLGGLAAFGTTGLLLGPLVVAFFLALVRIYERDYGRPTARPGDPPTPPENRPTET